MYCRTMKPMQINLKPDTIIKSDPLIANWMSERYPHTYGYEWQKTIFVCGSGCGCVYVCVWMCVWTTMDVGRA